MDAKGKIEFKRVNSDSYGNPRYVCHFLNFLKSFDERGGYELALKRAKEFGGRKYNNKSYGGGIVFHAVNPDELGEKIKYMMSKLNLEKTDMADKTQHTPGPWKIGKTNEMKFTEIRGNEDQTLICKVAPSFGSEEANAQLIASAPELLKENEQLKERASALNTGCGLLGAKIMKLEALNAELLEALKQIVLYTSVKNNSASYTTSRERIEEIKQLIAKAEGK